MNSSYTSSSTKPLFRGTQIIWYILLLIEVLLVFRFVLKLMAANPEAGFSQFIYAITWPFVVPFLAVFSRTAVADNIFEWTTLLAMLVYWLVAVAIVKLFSMSRTVSTPEAAAKMDKQD